VHHWCHLHFTSPQDSTFLAYYLRFVCVEAAHNLKTKSLDIILTPCTFVPISAFLLFLVSEVACGEQFEHFWHFVAYFWQFLPQLKKLSKNLRVSIIFVIDTTFVPNLTFLGLLSPETSYGEKTVTHPDRHTAYFAISEPQYSAPRNY